MPQLWRRRIYLRSNGKAAIQKEYDEWIKAGLTELGLTTNADWADENMLIEEGLYTFDTADGKTVDNGKCLAVYKKENWNWKLFRDRFNSDRPAAPAK